MIALTSIIILIISGERGLRLRPSTLASAREKGFGFRFLYLYFYMRWTSVYLRIVRALLPWLARVKDVHHLADGYHAKVLSPELAKKLILTDKHVHIHDLEQIIPYPAARQLVLDHPLDIVVTECPCRKISPHPCSPSKVCMVVGKPFTDFVLEHHPDTSKRLSQQEALDLLAEVHQQGCVHSAYFKDICFDRFYVMCNCCKCCCMGIKAMNQYGVPAVASSGYTARISEELCVHCGNCSEACPFAAISPNRTFDPDKCMGCGVCVTKCKRGAISLELDASKGIPLDIYKLSSLN
ncbi:MAG: 4Fe-4S binding protein [Thermincola sp.]|jgi:ferredoxin|nr:4Fe-4S binding protein [Thermincola sp.]